MPMVIQRFDAPTTGWVLGLMVLSGVALAGVVSQRRLHSRILLSQPTPRAGLVGSLGVVEAITAFGLAAILALLTSTLALVSLAQPAPLMDAARAYSFVRLVADSGATFFVVSCLILLGSAYSGRRSAYLRQLDKARGEYLSSLKQQIVINRTHAHVDDDGPTRTLRETIRQLEDGFLELLRYRPQAAEELNALYDALTKATEELVARELERRTSHVDLYGEEILNGPQERRGAQLGYLWRSRFGIRHLMRALGIPGRILFASGLSYVFLLVLVMSLDPGRPSTETNAHELALEGHSLRTALWAPELAPWPPMMAEAAPTAAQADPVVMAAAEAQPDALPIEAYDESSGAFRVGTLQSDAPARHHPAALRRLQRARLVKDSIAVSLELLELGRVSEARRKLRRLAESGDHDAALALGATYDPMAIGAHGSKNGSLDPRRAVYWYRKAHQLNR